MANGGPGGSIHVQKNKASGLEKNTGLSQWSRYSKIQRRAVSSSSMKTKVDIFLPHDVREVVLIPFFLQFSGFREDDILLEGVGEDNTMAFEEASRRRAVGKSRRAVGAKSSEIVTAGPRSTAVGNGNVFTPPRLSGSPYPMNRIAIPYAISFCGKDFHSSQ